MRRPIVLLFVFALIAIANSAGAAVPYVRILLPLYLAKPVPGAFGSVWQSQFAVHNGSDSRSYVIEWCSPADGSACILDLFADEELVANETQTALPVRYPAPANGITGAVLYLLPEAAPPYDGADLSFDLRVADTSRSALAAGTEIPVVRETAFRTSTLQLINVPTDPHFRLALRLFEMNLDRADFTVRIYDQSTNTLLSTTQVTSVAPPQGSLRFAPGFAQIDNIGGAPAVRVEIDPQTPGAAFWAYVSITNNDSQQITLVTPQ